MKRAPKLMIIVVMLLAACGSPANPTATNPTTEAPPPEATTAADPTATTAPTATVEAVATTAATPSTAQLEPERTVDEGGYAYRPPTGWTVETVEGGGTMLQPPNEPTIPVGIIMMGGTVSSQGLKEKLPSITTLDALFDEFLTSLAADDAPAPEATDRQDIMLGDVPARVGTVRTTENGQELEGQAVIARPQEDGVFVMLSMVPKEKWATIQPTFEAVQNSIRLFEPAEPAAMTTETAAPAATETAAVDVTSTAVGDDAAGDQTATSVAAEATTVAVEASAVAGGADPTAPGPVCAATAGFGVTCLDEGGWQSFTEQNSQLGGDYITAVARCPDNQMLFAHTSGISAWNGTDWSSYQSWGTGSADAMACDAEGGIWVAHFQGVSHFAEGSWTTHGSDKLATGPSANELVYDVVVAPDRKVWVATAQSVAMFNGSDWTVFQADQGFDKQYYISKLAIDNEGHVWAAYGDGLLEYDGASWTAHSSTQYVTAQTLAADPEGKIWVGTLSDGISVFDGTSWTQYDTEQGGLSSNHVNKIVFDGQGRAWVGTAYGLDVWDGAKWQAYHMHTAELVDNDIGGVAVAGSGPTLPALTTKAAGSLAGRVLRPDETPLASVAVEVCVESLTSTFTGATPCADQPLVRQTMTDTEGNFAVPDLPPGRYSLTMDTGDGKWAQLTGDFGISESAEVKPGEETNLQTITIKPE